MRGLARRKEKVGVERIVRGVSGGYLGGRGLLLYSH